MAEGFIDPTSQASLKQLEAALQAKIGELEGIAAEARAAAGQLGTVSRDALATQQAQARRVAQPLTASAPAEQATAVDQLAQAEARATAAVQERVALETRELRLAEELAAAQARTTAATAALGGAQAGQITARRGLAAARGGTEQDELAATQLRDAANEQAKVARQEVTAAQRNLEALQAQVAPLQQELGAARQTEAAMAEEAAQAQQRVALGAELAAAMRARLAQVSMGSGANEAEAVQFRSALMGAQIGGPSPRAAEAQAQAAGQYQQGVQDAGAALAQKRAAAVASQEQAAAASAAASAEARLGAATQKNVLTYFQANNELQRHGALTSEFIQAAARGEVTLRELGSQITTTIGKFAGWTVAAGAVYGVIGGVTELAKGAIDASNSVGQLTRTIDQLNRPAAGQALINLAHETNVSMKEAGDAVFLFSRTFHNLSDATYAAQLALMAFKLDGVSVADQVKSSTALTVQFGLSAQQLGPIYEMLAAGQRDYNARVTEQIPLLTRSASAVKNAGGDLTQYIELTTLALRTTQQSGSVIGTAFARSAANFLSPTTTQGQKDRAALSALGIDPNQSYTQVIVDAIKRAPSMTETQVSEMSKAIFGPLRGGLLQGLFTGGPSLLGPLTADLQKSAGGHTFLDEFAKEIGTSRQQLDALKNNVQQLGAALGQSGMTAPLGEVVHLADSLLSITTQLVGAWSKLPSVIRDAGTYLGVFAGARAIAGRFNVGIPLIGQSPGERAKTQLTTGVQAEADFYNQQRVAAMRTAALAGAEERAAAIIRNAAVGTEQEEAAQNAYETALARAAAAQNQVAATSELAVGAEERLNIVRAKLAARMTAENAAIAAGLDYRLVTQERGGSAAAVAVAAVPGAAETEAAAGAAGAEAGQIGLMSAAKARLQQQLSLENEATVAASAGMQASTVTVDAAAAAQTRLAAQVPLGTAAMTSLRASGATMSAGLSTLGASIGRFAPALLGIGIAVGAIEQGVQNIDEAGKQLDQTLNEQPKSIADLQKMAVDIANKADATAKDIGRGGQSGTLGDIFGWLSQQPVIGGVEQLMGLYSKPEGAKRQSGQIRSLGDAYKKIGDSIAQDAKTMTGSQSDREEFYQQLTWAEAWVRQHTPNTKQGDKALTAFHDTMQGYYQGFEQSLKLLPVSAKDPFAQFRSEDPKAIVTAMQATADRIKLYGADTASLAQLATAYAYLTSQFARSHNDTDLQLVVQAQSLFVDAVKKDAQDLVDQADVAGSKREKLSLLGQAKALIDTAKAKLTASEAVTRAGVTVTSAAYETAIEVQQRVDKTIEADGKQGVKDLLIYAIARATSAAVVAKDAKAMEAARKTLADVTKADAQVFAQLDAELKTINTQTKATTKVKATPTSEDPFELTRLRREIEQARAKDDPVRSAQIAEQLAQEEIGAAKNEHERLQGQLDLVTAENQYDQALQERTQSYYSMLEARTNDPIKQARIAVQAAAQAVQYEAENGGVNTKAYYDARAKQYDAQQKLVDGILSGKEQDIKFHLDMGQISVQTAIDEYEALLKMHNLTKQKREEILQQIHSWQTGSASAFGALDLGSIRLPTPYEIRRAALAAEQGIAVTNHYSTTIQVSDERGAAAVGVQMDRYHSGTGKAIARARGSR